MTAAIRVANATVVLLKSRAGFASRSPALRIQAIAAVVAPSLRLPAMSATRWNRSKSCDDAKASTPGGACWWRCRAGRRESVLARLEGVIGGSKGGTCEVVEIGASNLPYLEKLFLAR